MNARNHRIGFLVQGVGISLIALILATCESSLLTEIRIASAPTVYTVTFDSLGAEVPAQPESMTVEPPVRTVANLPTQPEKDGFAFGGWWAQPEGNGSRFFASTTVDTDVTVYAFWFDPSTEWTVTLGKAGGEGGTDSVTATFDQPMPEATAPTKEGKLFDGYFTGPNGSGTKYYTASMESARDWDIAAHTQLIANWRPWQIGETGPAGGIVFYDKGEFSDGWRYLEAAPRSEEAIEPWGGYGTEVVDARGTAIGTGAANTQAIVEKLGDGAEYAARVCADMDYRGYDDWFLPSKEELNRMYENLHQEGMGGFAPELYWSSSELNAGFASSQDFHDGEQYPATKYSLLGVRAARAF